MTEPTDGEFGEAFEGAYPAPAPDEIESAWARVATERPLRGARTGMLLRVAAVVLLVSGAFSAGFALGRSHHTASGNAVVVEHPPATAEATFPIRPPELLPARDVGGS